MKFYQLLWRIFLLIVLSSTIIVFFLTVFYPADNQLAELKTPVLPDDLDDYLQKSEASVQPKKDTQKEIQWFHTDHRITDYSIVYIHGFSATRREISPVAEDLAQNLKANIFFTRLKGHGLGFDDMGSATAADWIQDANEALAIGRRIGRKVILIGTSTGAALGVHLAKENPADVEALIFLSMNFRPRSPISWMTSGPLGSWVARMIIGKYLSFVPMNEKQAYFWTYKYPSSAVHQLMELLKYINTIDLGRIKIPLLMMYIPNDPVISSSLIEEKFPLFGSSRKKLFKSESQRHVMAGEIIAPEWTQPTIQEIIDFLKRPSP